MKTALLSLLRCALPADWADDVVRDLEEAHGRRRAEVGRLRAALWLAAEAALMAGSFGVERLRQRVAHFDARHAVGFLGQDVRLALRSLRASPVFTVAVVLTVGVSIGANTAIFSVVRAVLLDPLPYPAPERLVVMEPYPWTPAEIVDDVRRTGGAFEAMAGFYPLRFTAVGGERPVEIEGAVVTPGFFRLLGARMALGRDFTDGDARPDAPPTAILSHRAWMELFGGSADAIGRALRLDGTPYEVVGVAAEGFRQLTPRTEDPGVWTVAGMDRLGANVLPEGSVPWAIPVGRLAPDVSLERAQAVLDGAVERFRGHNPGQDEVPLRGVRWATLHSNLTDGTRDALLLLQAAVGLVLLLACGNVANLLLVRSAARRGEIALRTALGASRGRLFRQLLTESVVLAVLGGLAGLALMPPTLGLVLELAPPNLLRIGDVSPDATLLLLTLGVAVATGLLFGVVPGLAATRPSASAGLQETGRTRTASRSRHRLSQVLVVAQVTLTLVLVVSAGLLVRTFVSLAGQEPGFREDGVLAMRLSVPVDRYRSVPLLEDYERRLVGRLREVPGVASAALANHLPLERSHAIRSYMAEGVTEPREAQYAVVSPGYFRTLGIPVLRGRPFHESDDRTSPPVAVVDEALAREAWPGEDPVGKRVRFEDGRAWYTVVGVSADVRGGGLAALPGAGLHIPYGQRPDTPVELAVGRDIVILVGARAGAGELAEALRRAVWDVEPTQPVPAVVSLGSTLSESTRAQRFRATLFAAFAGLALLLAVAGIYGVVGHVLGERTHEFGIRRALGADDREIVRLALSWGLRLTAAGIALGLVGVVAAARLLSGLLFGVGATDALTVAAAVCAVLLVALLACVVPAVRAVRADPLLAMRSE